MAKRGRPSKKVLRKRKETKQKSELLLLLAVLMIVAICIAGYFMFIYK